MEINVQKLKVVHKPPSPPCIWFQTAQNDVLNDFYKLEDKSLDGYVLTLKKPRKKSLTANSYMWQLADKIAKKIGVTKNDVYMKAVKEVGAYVEMAVRDEDIDEAAKLWETNGIGWFVEPYHKGTGMTLLRFYQGSSVYDGEQMRRLIDYIVDEAKNLHIETMTTAEIERLKQLWQETVVT